MASNYAGNNSRNYPNGNAFLNNINVKWNSDVLVIRCIEFPVPHITSPNVSN